MTDSRGMPVLLAASHGTSDPAGQGAVDALVRAVARAKLDVQVLASFVDVQLPDVPGSIDSVAPGQSVVIVPLLLSAGYHVRVDLAKSARAAEPRDVSVTGALGPDDRLADILVARLTEAGLRPSDSIVMAAAGSSDANAVKDCFLIGRMLADRLGRPVSVGFISAAQPRLSDVIAAARAAAPDQRVIVATYLLAPGYFFGLASAAGADIVSSPLLVEDGTPPAALVDVVVDLYSAAAASGAAGHMDAGHRVGFYDGNVTAAYQPTFGTVTT